MDKFDALDTIELARIKWTGAIKSELKDEEEQNKRILLINNFCKCLETSIKNF